MLLFITHCSRYLFAGDKYNYWLSRFYFSYQSNLAKSCLDTILSIQPKDSSGGGGETREAVVQRLADDMLDKLPENYIAHEVSRKIAVPYHFLNKFIVSVK